MLHVKGNVRRAALTLSLEATGEIAEFLTQVESKLAEEGGTTAAAVASSCPVVVPSHSYKATVAKKPAVTCDYCHKVGHVLKSA